MDQQLMAMRFTLIFILLVAFWPLRSQVSSCGSELVNFSEDLLEMPLDFSDRLLSPYPKKNTSDTVAVTIHIVRNGFETSLDEAIIDEELAGANNLYSGTGLFFQRCGPVRFVNGRNVYNFDTGDELNRENRVPNTINIYYSNFLRSNDGGGLCGFAFFPCH